MAASGLASAFGPRDIEARTARSLHLVRMLRHDCSRVSFVVRRRRRTCFFAHVSSDPLENAEYPLGFVSGALMGRREGPGGLASGVCRSEGFLGGTVAVCHVLLLGLLAFVLTSMRARWPAMVVLEMEAELVASVFASCWAGNCWRAPGRGHDLSLRKGARKGTVEAPQLWDIMMDRTMAGLGETKEQQRRGVGLHTVDPRTSAEETVRPTHEAIYRAG